MRDDTLPESGPKRNLVAAAEELFAEHGFAGVSVRDITQRIKANVAAVHYHFGSREGLVRLVIVRHLVPIAEERLARLEAAERKWPNKVGPVEEILDAWLRPIVTAARKSELPPATYYKLAGHILAGGDATLPVAVEDQAAQMNERFAKAFAKSVPSVASDEMASRLQFVNGGILHLLTRQNIVTEAAMDTAMGRFIRFASAGLRDGAPPAPPTEKGAQATFHF